MHLPCPEDICESTDRRDVVSSFVKTSVSFPPMKGKEHIRPGSSEVSRLKEVGWRVFSVLMFSFPLLQQWRDVGGHLPFLNNPL